MIRDLFALIGVVGIVGAIVLVGSVYIDRAVKRAKVKARAEFIAGQNPYKSEDIQFLVNAGMTPEQIKQAIENEVRKTSGY